MTITVGGSTPTGTYPITVTGNGGGIQQTRNVVLDGDRASVWQQGFDFRNTCHVCHRSVRLYLCACHAPPIPRKVNGVTFGWVKTALGVGPGSQCTAGSAAGGDQLCAATVRRRRSMWICPRRARTTCRWRWVMPGTSNAGSQCQMQFFDGTTVLATVSGGPIASGYFYDAPGTTGRPQHGRAVISASR